MENGDEFSPSKRPTFPSLPSPPLSFISSNDPSRIRVHPSNTRQFIEERARRGGGGTGNRDDYFIGTNDTKDSFQGLVARDRKTYYDYKRVYKVESVVTNRDVHLSPAG